MNCATAGARQRPVRKEVNDTMQYATMVDLLQEAERAGERETAFVNDRLADAFELWLDQQSLGEITEEEEHELRMAFEKGFGICFHTSV